MVVDVMPKNGLAAELGLIDTTISQLKTRRARGEERLPPDCSCVFRHLTQPAASARNPDTDRSCVLLWQGEDFFRFGDSLVNTLDVVLLDGAKTLYPDVLALVESRLQPGSLVLADDAPLPGFSAQNAYRSGYLCVGAPGWRSGDGDAVVKGEAPVSPGLAIFAACWAGWMGAWTLSANPR